MMKKTVVILVALLAFTSFGTVSSARAFIDPCSLTVILGAAMAVVVAGDQIMNGDSGQKTEAVAVKDSHTQNQGVEGGKKSPGN